MWTYCLGNYKPKKKQQVPSPLTAGTISFGGVLMQHAQATGFMQAYPQPNLMNLGDTISEWNPLFQRPPTQQRAE